MLWPATPQTGCWTDAPAGAPPGRDDLEALLAQEPGRRLLATYLAYRLQFDIEPRSSLRRCRRWCMTASLAPGGPRARLEPAACNAGIGDRLFSASKVPCGPRVKKGCARVCMPSCRCPASCAAAK